MVSRSGGSATLRSRIAGGISISGGNGGGSSEGNSGGEFGSGRFMV